MNPATIGYNTEHVKPDEAPKKWSDLLHSRWKGQMTMDREESEWFANMLDVKGFRAPIEWVRADPVVAYHYTASVAAKGPHPNAARLFVDFLLSRKGQELIVKTKRVPVRNGVEPNPPHLVKGVRLLPSKTALAKDFKKHFAEYRRVFKVPERGPGLLRSRTVETLQHMWIVI